GRPLRARRVLYERTQCRFSLVALARVAIDLDDAGPPDSLGERTPRALRDDRASESGVKDDPRRVDRARIEGSVGLGDTARRASRDRFRIDRRSRRGPVRERSASDLLEQLVAHLATSVHDLAARDA